METKSCHAGISHDWFLSNQEIRLKKKSGNKVLLCFSRPVITTKAISLINLSVKSTTNKLTSKSILPSNNYWQEIRK